MITLSKGCKRMTPSFFAKDHRSSLNGGGTGGFWVATGAINRQAREYLRLLVGLFLGLLASRRSRPFFKMEWILL
ncbi:MAG: hypothetical protein EBS79_08545 [Gammaproteobacteria bacterium]|nr:hypothetical protein [Gammaproteobacteria bacterium]